MLTMQEQQKLAHERYFRWWLSTLLDTQKMKPAKFYPPKGRFFEAQPQAGYWFPFAEQEPHCEPGTRLYLWVMWDDGTQARGWWTPEAQERDEPPTYYMRGNCAIPGAPLPEIEEATTTKRR